MAMIFADLTRGVNIGSGVTNGAAITTTTWSKVIPMHIITPFTAAVIITMTRSIIVTLVTIIATAIVITAAVLWMLTIIITTWAPVIIMITMLVIGAIRKKRLMHQYLG
jgi:hypothetical protein